MSPKRKTLRLLAFGIICGGAIWIFSPWLTGRAEPWDADGPIWALSWLLVAVLGGLVGRVRGICLPLGYGLGQMLVTIRSIRGEFGLLGWTFIGGFTAVAVAGTLAMVGVIALFRRLARRLRAQNGAGNGADQTSQ
jgi:hypothetical protein